MPLIKEKQVRHFALDSCFRNRTKHFYIEDLLDACNVALEQKGCAPVSIRTLKRDLNQFEDIYDANIEHISDGGGRIYYRYEDPNFSIQKAPLTDEELARLKDTILMLSRFKGIPQFGWMSELITKIETKLHLNEHTESIIGFETNEYLIGLDYLEKLFDYISNQQTVEIKYQPYDKQGFTCTLHPYYIKQHNSRWFVLGMNNETGQMMHLALDRIQSIHPSKIAYVPANVDFAEYFDDVIGVTIPQDAKPEHILLKFTPHRLPYVVSKPLHPSQTPKDKEQGIMEITVIPNRELEAQLLWFGDDVEVLEPIFLREQIKEKIRNMYQLYMQ